MLSSRINSSANIDVVVSRRMTPGGSSVLEKVSTAWKLSYEPMIAHARSIVAQPAAEY